MQSSEQVIKLTLLKQATVFAPEVAIRILQSVIDDLEDKYSVDIDESAERLIKCFDDVEEEFQNKFNLTLKDYVNSRMI